MSRILVVLAVVGGLSGQAFAQSARPWWEPAVVGKFDFLSQYVSGAGDGVAYGKPTNQNDVWFGWQSGVYFNVWGSQILGTESPVGNYGNEYDYGLGLAGNVYGLGYDVSVNYFDLSAPKLFEFHGDMFQIAIELNKTFTLDAHSITPYVRAEPSWVVSGAAPFGAYFHLGVRDRWKMSDLLTLTGSARLVYDTGVYGAVPGSNLRFDLGPEWKLSDKVFLRFPYGRYYIPLSDSHGTRKNNFVFGGGIDWHIN